jgi:Flp pilus assembly protein TadD
MPTAHKAAAAYGRSSSERELQPTGGGARAWGRREWLVGLVLTGITLLTFSPVLGCEFVDYDDNSYVTVNPHVRAGLTWDGVIYGLTTLHFGNWHPLVWWSLMLDSQVYGLQPAGFHLTNLLWHTGSVLLLFAALRRMTGQTWPSAFVAALFAIHPLNVEPVAWVAERKGVISTFLWMSTLLAYCYYAERPGAGRYLLVCASFVLGLMAKPMLVTLPCVLLLLDFWPMRRFHPAGGAAARPGSLRFPPTSLSKLIGEKVPLVILSVAFVGLAAMAQRRAGALPSLGVYPLDMRLVNVAFSYVWYLQQAIYPWNLAVFHPFAPATFAAALLATVAVVLVAGITLLVLRQRHRAPYLAVGWLWYLVTLVPVCGIMQVGPQAQADRYAYIPLVGIFCLIAWGIADLSGRLRYRSLIAALASVLLAFLAITSWTQAHSWHDTLTLWEHALAKSGSSMHVHLHLAIELKRRGALPQAIEHYEAAVRISPDFEPARHGLGVALIEAGHAEEAIPHIRAAIGLSPELHTGHNDLGVALLRQGAIEEAVREFEVAQDLQPAAAGPRTNLGLALLRQGKAEEAVAILKEALRLEPEFAQGQYTLGLALAIQGEWERATACFRAAVQGQQTNVQYHRDLAYSLYRRGGLQEARAEYQECFRLEPRWTEKALRSSWMLSSDPRPGRRWGKLALVEAEEVQQAVEKDDPRVLDAMAAAFAENGRFSEAVAAARKAARLAATAGDRRLAGKIEERLRLYEKGQAYRARQP